MLIPGSRGVPDGTSLIEATSKAGRCSAVSWEEMPVAVAKTAGKSIVRKAPWIPDFFIMPPLVSSAAASAYDAVIEFKASENPLIIHFP
jgi:hypothetical protein